MSTPEYSRIRARAIALPQSDRAALVHDLIVTLDGEPEAGAASAWKAELLRRVSEIEAGATKVLSRKEFTERLSRHAI